MNNLTRTNLWRLFPSLLLPVVALYLLWPALVASWYMNYATLLTFAGLQAGDPGMLQEAHNSLISLESGSCRVTWLLSNVDGAYGNLWQRDQARVTTLRCSSAYIHIVKASAPNDIDLAILATQVHPDQAQSWFWLAELYIDSEPEKAITAYWQGLQLAPDADRAWAEMGRAFASLNPQHGLALYEQLGMAQFASGGPYIQAELGFIMARILAEEQPSRAIQLYRQGLELKPYDGVRWYELGDLLDDIDPQAAIQAYLQSCYKGDPGHHGCYGAGQVAKNLGDIQLAIYYYRMSRWDVAHQRAEQLEKMLH